MQHSAHGFASPSALKAERLVPPGWNATIAPNQREHAAAETTQYWIPKHVYVCAPPDSLVFLDVRRDKYFGVAAQQIGALSRVVESWPMPLGAETERQYVSELDAYAIANALEAKGLLTRDRSLRNSMSCAVQNLGRPKMAAGQDIYRRRPVVFKDLVNFAVACSSAAFALRCLSLEAIVNRVSLRKQRAGHAARVSDTDTVVELVTVFRRLRPYVFTAHDRCMFHALSLLDFLAKYDVFPTWAIGVKTQPWSAHTWLQHQDFILDGSPEMVRYYTPILAI